MTMRTAWRRLRHLESLAVRTVSRDIAKRRMRRSDTALDRTATAVTTRFDAPLPYRVRELPARSVELSSPRDHALKLLERVRTVLQNNDVPRAEARVSTAAPNTIALRAHDWVAAANLLSREIQTLLIGIGGITAGASEFVRQPSVQALEGAAVLHLLDPAVTLHAGRVISRYGFESAVRLERWDPTEEGRYTAAIWNPRTELLAPEAFRIVLDVNAEPTASSTAAEDAAAALQQTALLDVDFPIDVVYTWVDGTDPVWLARKRDALETDAGERMTEDAAADLRFVAHDELRHSLRSLEQYAPWVRHVYLVTDRQRPAWLREDHPRLTIVDHKDIAPAGTRLPSFNSQAIEANLHRIEGLSEHFLYFNDDVFLSSPVTPDLFFNPNGIASMYMSRAHVGPGAPVQGEPASDSAGKNARALVREATGRRVSRKLFHAPFALRRSVSYEIEERWPDVVAATRDAQFRRIDDVTLSGALHMNYAFATGRAVTRGIRYRYANVGAHDAAARLSGLERDRDVLQTFCLNESTHEIDPVTLDHQVRSFLHRRFPDTSSFEIPGA
ncbi:Stealth CR1 domain-containing protein [Brachybacterium vulturis]|uniref:stealth family protein n=1 Tax=Brachybacterium vulturis TaxID=2017484 RepID=UPI0037367274